MHKYKVGWRREDGSFKHFMSVGANNRSDAREQANYQLNRPGRIRIWVEWVKKGSQIRRVTHEQHTQ